MKRIDLLRRERELYCDAINELRARMHRETTYGEEARAPIWKEVARRRRHVAELDEQIFRLSIKKPWLVQAWRGSGNLPHVGEHNGIGLLFVVIALFIAASVALVTQEPPPAGRLATFALVCIMLTPFLAIFFGSAISRANHSDRIEHMKSRAGDYSHEVFENV